mmetsp:Transcript_11316/g.23142  ORF Transcript_11316/g.23142 Transcript_11316/m.23142 type:complete len:814 (+) Transcript_11316:357-2798(+)
MTERQRDRYSIDPAASSSVVPPFRTRISRSSRVIGTFNVDQDQDQEHRHHVPVWPGTNSSSSTSTSSKRISANRMPTVISNTTPVQSARSNASTVGGTCGAYGSSCGSSPCGSPSEPCVPAYCCAVGDARKYSPNAEEEDDPHDRIRSATTVSAFVTFLKALFGVSLLFQPRILGETGLVLGTIVHIVIITCCGFACYLLLTARFVAIDTKERKALEEEHRRRKDDLMNLSDTCLDARSAGVMPLPSRATTTMTTTLDDDPYMVGNEKVSPPLAASVPLTSASFVDDSAGPFCGVRDRFITYSDLVRQLLGKKAAVFITAAIFVLHVLFAAGMVASATRNLIVLLGWHISDDDDEQYEYEPDPGRRLGPSEDEEQNDSQSEEARSELVGGTGRLGVTALLFPVVLKLLLIRNLAGMFFVSALGLIAYFVGCVGSMVYSAMTFSEWEGGLDAPEDIWEWKWAGIPTFVASTVYAIEGINLALPTANNISDNRSTFPIVGGAVLLYGLLTLAVAWVGYIGGLAGGAGTRHGENSCHYISYCLSSDVLTMVHELSLCLALLLTLPVILYPATELLEIYVTEREAAKEAASTANPTNTSSAAKASWWSFLSMGMMRTYANRIKVFSHTSNGSDESSSSGGAIDYVDMDAPGYRYPNEENGVSSSQNDMADSSNGNTRGDMSVVETAAHTDTVSSPRSVTPVSDEKHPADVVSAHFWPRLGLAIAVCTIAALEEHFYSIINFARGVLLSFAGFIIPPILYYAAVRVEREIHPLMTMLLVGLILFGVFTMVLAFIPSFTEQEYMTMDVEEARDGQSRDD